MTASTPLPTSTPSPEAIVVNAVSRLRLTRDPGFHRLKRGSQLLDAMLEPVFAQTVRQLRAIKCFSPEDNIACALLLQPYVGASANSVGAALSSSKRTFSSIRFAQLVASDTPEELFTNLQRALQFVEGRASAFDVARLALGWTELGADRMRKRLIGDFHALPRFAPANN